MTQRLPYAPNRGDRVRAYFLLRALRQFADVDVISLVHDAAEASEAAGLATLASPVRVAVVPRVWNAAHSLLRLPTRRPTTHTMLDSPQLASAILESVSAGRPDVVVAYCSSMARFAMRPPLAGVPMVLDMVDVDSAKWAALADTAGPAKGWLYRREARVLRQFEELASRHAVCTLVTTPAERDLLVAIAPDTDVRVIGNGVDVESLRPPGPPAAARDVVFCGVMNYAPNTQAALYLASEVWPLVRAVHGDAILKIVGAAPPAVVMNLANPATGVVVTGTVVDVRPYLWQSAVAVAPLHVARGIQNKALEAVAAGLPVVVTPNVLNSLPAEVAKACVAGATTGEIATAIIRLLDLSPTDRRGIADRADMSTLTWERQLADVPSLVQLALSSPRRREGPVT